MLVQMAIADAYGASFEFQDQDFVDAHNTGSSYAVGKRGLDKGAYTDDTQMSLALAELLLEKEQWSRFDIAGKFLEVFKRDPRLGYASGFYNFLQHTHSAENFLATIRQNSTKSGAAMRAAPLGVIANVDAVIGKSYLQASITHNTQEGLTSATATALASYYFYHELGDKKDLPHFLSGFVSGDWFTPWRGVVSVEGMDCIQAALTAIQQSNTLTELLVNCVAFGGDTDTVAAISLGIVNTSSQFEHDLSPALFHELENKQYGYDDLLDIERKLYKQYPKKTSIQDEVRNSTACSHL